MTSEQEGYLRDFAAGRTSWSMLRERGYDSYLEVLAGLGELGLRPPIAPELGREQAIGWLKEAVDAAAS